MAGDYKRAFRLNRRRAGDARGAVDDELALHIEMCVDELIEQGWAPDAARQEAIRQFGDVEQTRTYCTDMQTRRGRGERRSMVADDLRQDLVYAVRALFRAPGYAALVIITLAFGIAANTTIFSVMNPYLFRPLPYGDADRLVHVTQVDPVTGWHMARFSSPIVEDWKARTRTLESVAAYSYRGANLTGPEGAETLTVSYVSADLFEVLDATPVLGRTFASEEGGPGGQDVVVLSESLWQRRWTGDPAVIGRVIQVDGVPHTVVGVMQEDFVFPFGGVRMWLPIREDPTATARGPRVPYLMVGRMAPGATRESVERELTSVQAELGAMYPAQDGKWRGVTVLPMRQALNFVWDVVSVGFTVLLVAVVFVLAIACVNVAGLTLARGSSRTRELSVRSALGAPRGRVVRQLLAESLVLALVGGVLGVTLSYAAAAVIGPLIPEDLYRVGKISIDGTVLVFSLLVTLATPLLFGLAPALAATRRSLSDGLKEGSKSSASATTSRGRRALVTIQVALAVVLTTGAGLMLRSFSAVQGLDVGFTPDRVVVATVQPPQADYSLDEVKAYVARATEELQALPGVRSASASLYIPLNHETPAAQIATRETSGLPAEEWPVAVPNYPYPGYFETMGIPLLAGRTFSPADNVDAERVVIVSQAMAERYWPGGSPIGETLLTGEPTDFQELTVIGVVGTVRHQDLEGPSLGTQIYIPALQGGGRRHFLLARTDGDPASLIAETRSTLRGLDPNLPVIIRPMSDIVAENTLQWSLGAVFLAVFSGGALLLATLGIYGTISFGVSQRRREMGVRMALGASRADVRRVIVGEGLRLTGVGVATGFVLAVVMAQLIAALLYGVSPLDPLTLGGVLMLFIAVGALASWIPAERASRTNPTTVLRTE